MLASLDDAALVHAARDGDMSAFTELVERHQGAIYACAWQVLRNAADAEDSAQEAFVQAYEKLASLREPRYFFSWTWRICTTIALRRRVRGRRVASGLEGYDAGVEDGAPPVELTERDSLLLEALATLPDEQREALTLRFWEGLDYSVLADLLGISHAALYQRVSRGLKRLREVLGDDFPEAAGSI